MDAPESTPDKTWWIVGDDGLPCQATGYQPWGDIDGWRFPDKEGLYRPNHAVYANKADAAQAAWRQAGAAIQGLYEIKRRLLEMEKEN